MALAVAAPLFAPRAALQDLFFIFTMLALAQCWNLLAGYAGLVSVGQQAFVGLGGYALFARGHPRRRRSAARGCLAGIVAALLAVPTAFVVFRLQGAYFAIGTWVVAEVVRLVLAQLKALGGGTGTSLPRPRRATCWARRIGGCSASARRQRATSSSTGWRWRSLVVTIGCRLPAAALARGLASPPCATTRGGGERRRRRPRTKLAGLHLSPPSAPASPAR